MVSDQAGPLYGMGIRAVTTIALHLTNPRNRSVKPHLAIALLPT